MGAYTNLEWRTSECNVILLSGAGGTRHQSMGMSASGSDSKGSGKIQILPPPSVDH